MLRPCDTVQLLSRTQWQNSTAPHHYCGVMCLAALRRTRLVTVVLAGLAASPQA